MRFNPAFGVLLAALLPVLGGCSHGPVSGGADLTDHDCLARVMYFESLRSSDEGMLAVGTTVMNRLADPRYPKTVCGVVGQPHQYAPGVLSNPVSPGKSLARAERIADDVLAGARHPQVGSGKFFHTVGWHYPYNDAHYLVVAGGNAFYEKVAPQFRTFVHDLQPAVPNGFAPPPPPFGDPEPLPLRPVPVMVASRTPAEPSFAPRPPRPRTIDDLLAYSAPRPPVERVSDARLSPAQLHPFTD